MDTGSKMKLVLEDGTQIQGTSFGYQKSVAGEVVFNTAMTGYPESLSDPSYKGQLLVLTYPLIGNYGVPKTKLVDNLLESFESSKVQIGGLIVSEYSGNYNHWNAEKSLGDWLKENKVSGMFGVDTRMLTKIIREKGAMLGKMICNDEDVESYDPDKDNLVDHVSIKERIVYGNGKEKILLVDCGVKNNIIRHLIKRDVTVIRVPWDYDFLKEEYDGILMSNGPGNPKQCEATINNLSVALKQTKPIMGICLGNQLMALASGADTYKLKYGHRSHNQPVILANSNKAYITSQNHGYAIDQRTLPEIWEPLFTNLNDGTNEGIRHRSMPFFSAQFHPEASSGPTDTEFLFDDFLKMVKEA